MPAAPSHPGEPDRCIVRCFTVGVRLHQSREAGRSHACHEAETGSRFRIAADVAVFPGFARRVAPVERRFDYMVNEQLP